jgi:hypothetical protein
MSLFSWLAKSVTPSPGTQPGDALQVLALRSDGTFPLACVGESHYQAAFEAICGPRQANGELREVSVSLMPEDDNAYDPNAVRVQVNESTVGYLSRPDAIVYRRLVSAAAGRSSTLSCRGQIRGGWTRGGDKGSYGIWLELPLHGPKRLGSR